MKYVTDTYVQMDITSTCPHLSFSACSFDTHVGLTFAHSTGVHVRVYEQCESKRHFVLICQRECCRDSRMADAAMGNVAFDHLTQLPSLNIASVHASRQYERFSEVVASWLVSSLDQCGAPSRSTTSLVSVSLTHNDSINHSCLCDTKWKLLYVGSVEYAMHSIGQSIHRGFVEHVNLDMNMLIVIILRVVAAALEASGATIDFVSLNFVSFTRTMQRC